MSQPVVDALLGEVVLHNHPLELVSANPPGAQTGRFVYNTTTQQLLLRVGNAWVVLAAGTEVPKLFRSITTEDNNALLTEDNQLLLAEAIDG